MRTPPAKLLLGAVLAALLALPATAGAAYRDVIAATPNLVSQWRLGDPAASTIATDSTGLQDGSYAGSPSFGATGALANDASTAIGLGATGARFSAPNRSEYANAQTVEFWVRLNSYGDTTRYRAMASKGYDVSQRNWLIALGNNATGQLTYGFGSGGSAVGRRSAATLALNTWYLIDYVHTSAGVNLYINGALDSTLSSTATPVAGTDPVILGDDGQTGATADARYDELSLYSGALTSTQVAAHYAAGSNPTAICNKVASVSTGSDTTGTGTAANPYRSSLKLANSLTAGQTGCLRAGTYTNGTKLTLSTTGTTLQTYPGDARATLADGIWIRGDTITLQELKLDGTTTTEATSPTINGTGDVLRYDDITNGDTKICVDVSVYNNQTGTSFLIERNRIHNCGGPSGLNHDHGVYLSGNGGLIRDNAIFDNQDRGVQIYPDGDNNVIENNTIDGNGEGVSVGGDAAGVGPDGNRIQNNIISNAQDRFLIESPYYNGAVGTGDTATGNCLYANNPADPTYYNSNNGVDPEATNLTVAGSIVGDPLFTNRASKDFTLRSTSACLGKGAPRDVAAP
jgi:hypothetical protein